MAEEERNLLYDFTQEDDPSFNQRWGGLPVAEGGDREQDGRAGGAGGWPCRHRF